MKTSKLQGAALDWAVAKCEDKQGKGLDWVPPAYSTDWAQGGAIIERERIPTPLIAALRCYVASKLGDEVEIPKELE